MYINDLNGDCLDAIFARFVLQELLPLRAVCQLWDCLVEQRCVSQKSLKLFSCPYDVIYYGMDIFENNLEDDTKLWLKSVAKHSDDLIAGKANGISSILNAPSLFPNVQNLVIDGMLTDSWDCAFGNLMDGRLISFVHQWSHSLTCLNLYDFSLSDLCKQTQIGFWSALSEIATLESLHLLQSYLTYDVIPTLPIVVNRLKHFSIRSCPISVLGHLGPNIEQLRVFFLDVFSFRRMNELFPSLNVLKIAHLSLRDFYLDKIQEKEQIIQLICRKFASLQSLNMSRVKIESVDTFVALRSLKHLTKLYLQEWNLNFPNNRNLPRLQSVKLFRLNNHYTQPTLDHTDQLCVQLAHLFPNLAELRFDTCHPEKVAQVAECVTARLGPTVKFVPYYKLKQSSDDFSRYEANIGPIIGRHRHYYEQQQ